ncbi:MAG TPA: DUF92 domain-containing protein [Thermoanaerobaculia bacterium]|nr:DUF92 domain-containing protein [Thermoanaerobaculia bacterium]HUM28629.1 DUF92 domain-containing protein [Thermoanaerobaculia bacterium]HXK66763.1 DUF92 domain-containing protein [Thermoanaerobaculia bacterium]
MALTGRELGRKSLHMAMGLFALALKYLTPWQAALCAIAAFLHNLFILPHTARFVLRGEKLDAGLLAYPLAVLGLILVYWKNPALAAAAWGYLAFGDGMATVTGKSLPLWKPGWAGGKSLGGFLAFALAGGASANLLYNFVGDHEGFLWAFWVVGLALAFIELMPMPINDNIVIPFFAAALLALVPPLQPGGMPEGRTLLLAGGINLGLALVSFAAGLVSSSALVGGVVVGTLVLGFGGWPAWSLLVGFFVLATSATKLGYAVKSRMGLAQEEGGRRGSRHALANCSTGAALSLLLPFYPEPMILKAGIAAAFATALSDTLGSEIGQLLGKTPIHPLTLRRVPVGTEGAVSLEGTLAGVAGSLILASIPLIWGWYPGRAVLIVAVAAFSGSMVESVLGSLGSWDNEILNFINTAVGAAVACLAAAWLL